MAWQRVDQQWKASDSETGGWQGSRLTQICFAVDLTTTLRQHTAALSPNARPTVLSIADDTYLWGNGADIAEQWDKPEAALEESGHRLRRRTCKWLAAAVASAEEGAAAHSALAKLIPQSVGGLPLPGTAAHGEMETWLGL